MEHLTLPSVGTSFKKWGCCTPIPPKAPAHFSNFQKNNFKNFKNFKNMGTELDRGQASTRGQRATAGHPPTADRHMIPVRLCVHFFEFFSLLPSIFCACGQLLLVGSSTCLPWPDPAQKLQTPITFDL
jgi:hypothetical protein